MHEESFHFVMKTFLNPLSNISFKNRVLFSCIVRGKQSSSRIQGLFTFSKHYLRMTYQVWYSANARLQYAHDSPEKVHMTI